MVQYINIKARLVVKGFKQNENVDFFNTYSPVTRVTSIRLLIVIVATHNLQNSSNECKNSFLNGALEEEYVWIKRKVLYSLVMKTKFVS